MNDTEIAAMDEAEFDQAVTFSMMPEVEKLRDAGVALICGHVARYEETVKAAWDDPEYALLACIEISEHLQDAALAAWSLASYPRWDEDWSPESILRRSLMALSIRCFARETFDPRYRIVVVEARLR